MFFFSQATDVTFVGADDAVDVSMAPIFHKGSRQRTLAAIARAVPRLYPADAGGAGRLRVIVDDVDVTDVYFDSTHHGIYCAQPAGLAAAVCICTDNVVRIYFVYECQTVQ